MKIYTKTGDKGTTALYGGARVSKSDFQVEVFGIIDELLSYVGLIRSQEGIGSQEDVLKEIQDRLFSIGSHIAADPEKIKLKKPEIYIEDVELLEKNIDLMDTTLEPLKQFILPGGNMIVSFCHLARVISRKVERRVVELRERETGIELSLIMFQYLNRLSDYFFVLSRYIAKELNVEEFLWNPRVNKD